VATFYTNLTDGPLWRANLIAGEVGPDARALGGELMPLHANFAPDRDLFLKTGA